MTLKKIFAHQLMTARIQHGWSQRYLAQLLGISPRAIGQFEQGANLPSVETLVALARVLEVSTDWMLGLSDHR